MHSLERGLQFGFQPLAFLLREAREVLENRINVGNCHAVYGNNVRVFVLTMCQISPSTIGSILGGASIIP